MGRTRSSLELKSQVDHQPQVVLWAGPSQTGNTYFAINSEEYLTAFWNWTWNGDEALCLKCTYTMNGSSITLNSCLEYNTRDEWQYLSNKTFTVQAISYDDIPTNLTSKSHFVIYAD